jgi:hypothetical protein
MMKSTPKSGGNGQIERLDDELFAAGVRVSEGLCSVGFSNFIQYLLPSKPFFRETQDLLNRVADLYASAEGL